MILGCVLLILSVPGVYEGVFIDGLSGLWHPYTLVFGVLPLVLGALCLRTLKGFRSSGEPKDRLRRSEVSHACGLVSGILLPLALLTGALGPGFDWIGLCLLSSSALAAVASIAFAVAARRSRAQSAETPSRLYWGWIPAMLLLCCYSAVIAYNVWWWQRFERYEVTERILIRNGLILELNRRADGQYFSPGFDGSLAEAITGHGADTSRLVPNDGWDHPIRYSCSDDGQDYEMVSTGANGSIEWRRGSEEADIGDDLDQDIVFVNGTFRRYRWGGWCCPFKLQETSIVEMEDWLRQLPVD